MLSQDRQNSDQPLLSGEGRGRDESIKGMGSPSSSSGMFREDVGGKEFMQQHVLMSERNPCAKFCHELKNSCQGGGKWWFIVTAGFATVFMILFSLLSVTPYRINGSDPKNQCLFRFDPSYFSCCTCVTNSSQKDLQLHRLAPNSFRGQILQLKDIAVWNGIYRFCVSFVGKLMLFGFIWWSAASENPFHLWLVGAAVLFQLVAMWDSAVSPGATSTRLAEGSWDPATWYLLRWLAVGFASFIFLFLIWAIYRVRRDFGIKKFVRSAFNANKRSIYLVYQFHRAFILLDLQVVTLFYFTNGIFGVKDGQRFAWGCVILVLDGLASYALHQYVKRENKKGALLCVGCKLWCLVYVVIEAYFFVECVKERHIRKGHFYKAFIDESASIYPSYKDVWEFLHEPHHMFQEGSAKYRCMRTVQDGSSVKNMIFFAAATFVFRVCSIVLLLNLWVISSYCNKGLIQRLYFVVESTGEQQQIADSHVWDNNVVAGGTLEPPFPVMVQSSGGKKRRESAAHRALPATELTPVALATTQSTA